MPAKTKMSRFRVAVPGHIYLDVVLPKGTAEETVKEAAVDRLREEMKEGQELSFFTPGLSPVAYFTNSTEGVSIDDETEEKG